MNNDEMRAFVQRIYDEVYTAQRAERVDDFYAVDCELGDPALPGVCHGTEIIKGLIATYASALSDVKYEVKDLIVQGDRVAFEFVSTAKHDGPGLGVAPTNQPIEIGGMVMATVTDGKITQVKQYWDRLDFYAKVGLATVAVPGA